MTVPPGKLVSTWDVEQAAIATLREWVPFYLSSAERQHGLPHQAIPRPPSDECYYGGLDFQSEVPGVIPVVVVVVEPTGETERSSSLYVQGYDLKVGCTVIGDNEEQARLYANMYGQASMLLAHIGSLQGVAENTIMTVAPAIEWVDPDPANRRFQRSVATFETWATVLEKTAAPAGTTLTEAEIPDTEAPAVEQPTVETVDITVEAQQGEA